MSIKRPSELLGEVSLDLNFNISVTTDEIYNDAVISAPTLDPNIRDAMTEEEKSAALEWERSIMFWTTQLNNFRQGRTMFYELVVAAINSRKCDPGICDCNHESF